MYSKTLVYRLLSVVLFSYILQFRLSYASDSPRPIRQVKVASEFFNANTPTMGTTKRLIDLMKEEPSIHVEQWGGLSLPGGGGKAGLMLAIAGKTAPDVGSTWFHLIRNEIKQGFLYPLNEWIGDDLNGNGLIDDDETKWEPWKRIPPLWRRVATVDGKVYAIPQSNIHYMGILYRTDLLKAAGLNPNRPPQTWDELIYWCQKLTDPAREVPGAVVSEGQRGIVLSPYGFSWLPWMQSAGGSPIIQVRKSPTTGKEYEFTPEEEKFITASGEDLSKAEPEWRANFSSPEGIEAAELYHKLRWMKWLIDPESGEPVTLTEGDLQQGKVIIGNHEIIFSESDVITGVCRVNSGQRGNGTGELFARGEAAMFPGFVQDLTRGTAVNPDMMGWFPFPAVSKERGHPVVQVQQHYVVAYEALAERSKEERDAVWRVMTAVADEKARDNDVRNKVLSGMARFANPHDLKRLGYDEYLQDIPQAIRDNFEGVDSGRVGVYTEPWMGFWVTMDQELNNQVLSLTLSNTGEAFDYKAGLQTVQHKANSGIMFDVPQEELDKCRPYARGIFVVVLVGMLIFAVLIVKSHLKKSKSAQGARSVYDWRLAWGLVLPAVVLIGLWSYYPLLRGMVMAFQDYRITGESKYIGLDNFINLALDKSFWMSLLRTLYFVALNMVLAFTAPIFLAILLTDVPRFKIFFRTLFFLPQMTSGLVIALLWKLMYNSTPQGFFNQMISYLNYIPFVHIENQSWLEDPNLAMLCCVIPTVWASMGMASLIYIAALHSLPEELYEAAEIDGAGIISKMRHITIPAILPLIIINFVGAFIGTFQNMGNIFLLTFGGPGDATTVVGLKIWIEAYNNLRFSMATSMAWVMGALLIGFAYFQIKFLGRVEYRRAKD